MSTKKTEIMNVLQLKSLIIQICYAADSPCGTHYISGLVGLQKEVVEGALLELEEDGLVKKSSSKLWYICKSRYSSDKNFSISQDLYAPGSLEFYVASLQWNSWHLHIGELFQFLDEQLYKKDKRAVCLLDLVIRFFVSLSDRLQKSTDGHVEKFLMITPLLSTFCSLHQCFRMQRYKIYSTWYAVFISYKPKRLMPFLGLLELFSSFASSKKSKSALQIESLSSLRSFSQFAQGADENSSDGVVPFKKAFQLLQEIGDGTDEPLVSAVVGNIWRVMAHAARNSEITKDEFAFIGDMDSKTLDAGSPSHIAHYCFVLLYQGLFDEALEQLDALSNAEETQTNPVNYAVVARGIATYHFFHGRISHAYHVLKKASGFAIKIGLPHFDFLDPIIFDMLYVFEQRGYPPIPRYELNDAIERKLSHGNLLKCVAMRIKALRVRRAKPATALALLHESLQLLNPDRNEREVIITSHELASTLVIMGEYAEAQRWRRNARELAGVHIEAEIPYSELAIVAAKIPNSPYKPKVNVNNSEHWSTFSFSPENIEKKSRELTERVADIPLSLELKVALGRLIDITDEVLETVRVGIASFQQDRCFGWLKPEQNQSSKNSFLYLDESTWERLQSSGICFSQGSFYSNLDVENIYPWILRIAPKISGANIPRVKMYAACLLVRSEINKLIERHAAYASRTEIKFLEDTPKGVADEDIIVGTRMNASIRMAEQAATADTPVLIFGETGVGKELVARHIHNCSGRKGNFVAVNAAGISESLFESEFFGHERGAFTGAINQRKGLFEEADGGTIFIDEIGDIPFSMQAKLLRVLQDRKFTRVGGNKLLSSSFRLITATNKNLQDEVNAGNFRSDLFFRIAVFPIEVPALRSHPKDVIPLCKAYINYFSQRYGKKPPQLSKVQESALKAYYWPGNVRELKNVMERTVLQSCFNTAMLAGPTQRNFQGSKNTLDFALFQGSYPSLAELEKLYLEYIMKQTNGQICGPNGAAAILGEKTSTMYAKIKRLGKGVSEIKPTW